MAGAAATPVAEALAEAELDTFDDTEAPVAGDFKDPGRTEVATAAAACGCWPKGKMKAGPC